MDWDDAYANAPYIEDAQAYPERWATDAVEFRKKMKAGRKAKLDISYGDSLRQRFDLFRPNGQPKGLCVFVHGGYWLKFHRSYWSHFSAGLLENGWCVAMPSYDLCPDVKIVDITQQIAAAICRAADVAEGPILLVGHSAGGHLVARMCVDGMLPAKVFDRIRHVMPISPVSDLRPLINTAMNVDFKLDERSAMDESPALMLPRNVPVTVWVGAAERPVFLDQARWLAEAWGARHVIDPKRHHFDVIDGLKSPDSAMVQRLLS